MVLKTVFVLYIAVLVYQCSGQDKYDAIVGITVEPYSPPSAPLFVISTVTQGVCVCVCVCVCAC